MKSNLDEVTPSKSRHERMKTAAPNLYAALKQIYLDYEDDCGCECNTETCCAVVGERCAKCYANRGLALVDGPKENEMKIEFEEERPPSNHDARSERQEPGFTRGPWFTKWNGAYGHMVYGSDGSGSCIAIVSGVAPGVTTAQGKANARLFAAAPALYEAVKELIGVEYRHGSPAKRKAELLAAIEQGRAALALVDGPQTKETK